LRYSGTLHHRDDSGAHRGRDLRGIGKSPCTVEPNPTVGAGSEGGWFIGGRMPNAKSIGWAIYSAGFVIWLFGYLSVGHAPAFDWVAVTPWWISSFVPNLEAEFGLALMFASMVPIYLVTLRGRPGPKYDVRPSAGECEPHKRINQK
jgi:hypothetical protein